MLQSNFHIQKYLDLYSKQILLKTTPQRKTNYKQIKISFWLCALEAPVAATSFRKNYKSLNSTREKIIVTKPVQRTEQSCMEPLLGSRLSSYILHVIQHKMRRVDQLTDVWVRYCNYCCLIRDQYDFWYPTCWKHELMVLFQIGFSL